MYMYAYVCAQRRRSSGDADFPGKIYPDGWPWIFLYILSNLTKREFDNLNTAKA